MFRELARNHRVNMYCVWPRTDETSSKIRFSKIEPPHICKPINCVWFVFSWPALPSSQCRLCWPQSKSQTKFNDVQDNFSCDIIALWLDKVSPDWETEFLLVQDAGFKWNTLPRADKGNRNPWGLPQTYSGRCLEIRLVDIAMDFCKSHGRHMSSTRKGHILSSTLGTQQRFRFNGRLGGTYTYVTMLMFFGHSRCCLQTEKGTMRSLGKLEAK